MNTVLAARSLLFVPGHQPERYAKALASGADAVIVDLEDAVPVADKAAAAQALRDAWSTLDASRVLIRINPRSTRWHDADVALCAALRPAAVVVPKAEHPDHLLEIAMRGPGDDHGRGAQRGAQRD